MTTFRNDPADGILQVANSTERLALMPSDGLVVQQLDTHTLYIYDALGASWSVVGGGAGAVSTVFGRTGAIVATSGDYNTSQVTENTNLYFTQARTIASPLTGYVSGAGTISSSDTILIAIQKLNGNISAVPAYIFSTGLTNTTGTITVNTSQNIGTLSNLTTNGFVKTSGSNGTLSVDTSTYLTANQTITLHINNNPCL